MPPTTIASSEAVEQPHKPIGNYQYDPLAVLVICFGLAATSGIATLLRSKEPLSLRTILAAVTYNGLAGLTMALLLWNVYGGANPFLLIAVSIMAGMGLVDLVGVAAMVVNGLQSAFAKKGPGP